MSQHKAAYHVLRLTLGITFLWISVMIFQEPTFWSGFMDPWAASLVPLDLETLMKITAGLDLLIGLLLVANKGTWIASLIASVHLLVILITSGIDTVTVRDLGLLGAAVALTLESLPSALVKNKKQDTSAPDLQAFAKAGQDENP
ncbi:hypothetical protein HY631_03575 [Candidatus Uhrbacteria bacterium]|nr:hypothetical protein [Candidatus Uhrbacteria bacterium]